MNLRTLIVEDEAASREILAGYLKKYCPDVEVVGQAANIAEALACIGEHPVDLVFLDVEMPFGNAFDFLEQVPDRDFETVFVTAYEHYAREALNHHAAYYLMKPLSIDELIKAVEFVGEVRAREAQLGDSVLQAAWPLLEGRVTVPQLDGFEVLQVADILYCRADDNYTRIIMDDRKVLASKTLKYFEEALANYPFVRIHKSYLVNVGEVVRYKRGKGGSVVLSNGEEISVSASRKKDLLSYF